MEINNELAFFMRTDEEMFKLPLEIDKSKKIGLIDADLLDNGTRHPNLALMKISSYFKNSGNNLELVTNYNDYIKYDILILSRVFTFTKIPSFIFEKELILGGTGFSIENFKTYDLPNKIEHSAPDYDLYSDFVKDKIAKGDSKNKWKDYIDYSIGFITRGCFRKCDFCVNKKYDFAFKHAELNEFLDKDRKKIYLWDDNFLAYPKWEEELDKLILTGKYFQFKQGLDIRLMTDKIAKKLSKCKYYGDFIFAFDHIEDAEEIEKKLKIWRKHCEKGTKLYLFCAYNSQDENDIDILFQRIEILFRNKCLPYIMRYESYKDSQFEGVYINVTRWANQQNIVKKMSFREFCEREQSSKKNQSENCSSMRSLLWFEEQFPHVAEKYFDLKYSDY